MSSCKPLSTAAAFAINMMWWKSLMSRGRIHGKIQTKGLRVFFLVIAQSPLQLCLKISISSNSHNLFQFLQFSCYIHCKWERRKIIPPSLWFKKSIQNPQVWEHSRLCSENSTKLNVHEFSLKTLCRTSLWREAEWHFQAAGFLLNINLKIS